MKYLIVGLGNVGTEYQNTRHNIGFNILDTFAEVSNVFFEDHRYGFTATVPLKGKTLVLLKPSTFMNLSGMAVRYWMQKEKIPLENLLVVVDDLALPFGTLRLKPSGSNAGHNGLRNIEEVLGTQQYARLRFGLGNNFAKGAQIHFVLSKWTEQEQEQIPARAKQATEMIKSFVLAGMELTMTQFNNK
ncbi:MAG: aminoacyl-tRNA hydrolase [Prevotellaceae bacterium]|jgi:PTH1 family peptidyl-tRNA hydrolase|nr:aminoacyl-tRNA hydrolase [Prevotellaceae bacterium]